MSLQEDHFQLTLKKSKKDLQTVGFCLIKDVVSPENLKELHEGFWNFIERSSPAIKRGQPETWGDENWPSFGALRSRGMITAHGISQADFIWKARELCLPVFEAVWGTHKLIVAHDRYECDKEQQTHKNEQEKERRLTHKSAKKKIVFPPPSAKNTIDVMHIDRVTTILLGEHMVVGIMLTKMVFVFRNLSAGR